MDDLFTIPPTKPTTVGRSTDPAVWKARIASGIGPLDGDTSISDGELARNYAEANLAAAQTDAAVNEHVGACPADVVLALLNQGIASRTHSTGSYSRTPNKIWSKWLSDFGGKYGHDLDGYIASRLDNIGGGHPSGGGI